MDFEGNTLANTGDIDALAARVSTLEGEVTTINTEIASIDNQLNYLQTAAVVSNNTTSLTGNVIEQIAMSSAGTTHLNIPFGTLQPGLGLRFKVYGQLTNPSANNLLLYVSADNIGDNAITPDNTFGLPIYLTPTPVIIEMTAVFQTIRTSPVHFVCTVQNFWSPPSIQLVVDQNTVNPAMADWPITLWGKFDNVGSTLTVNAFTMELIGGWATS